MHSRHAEYIVKYLFVMSDVSEILETNMFPQN